MAEPADTVSGQEALRELQVAVRRLLTALGRQDQLSGHVGADVARLKAELGQPGDLKEVDWQDPEGRTLALLYLEGGADPTLVAAARQAVTGGGIGLAPCIADVTDPRQAAEALLKGDALLLSEGRPAAVLATPASEEAETTKTERVVRGPATAVAHRLDTTLAALRTVIRSPDLVVEKKEIGRLGQSRVAVVHVRGLALPAVVERVGTLLDRYAGSVVLDTSQLTPLFADDPWVVFPIAQATERIDTVAEALSEGRVAVLVDGSPTALLLPTTLASLLSSPEDKYLPRFMADFARLLRYASALLTPFFEPVFIALATVDRALLPTPLAVAIARARAGVPLPTFAEVLLMALVVEVLREAAIRLPNALSQAIAIVGGLVLGEAVVSAQLVSAPVIVVVALTALTSFLVPSYELAMTIRLVRYVGMVLGGLLGLYGVTLYALFLLTQMARIRSFGLPYLFPLAPMRPAFWRVVLRVASPVRRRRGVLTT